MKVWFVLCEGSSRSASVSTSALSGSSSGSTSSVMSASAASVSGRPPRASYSSLRDTSYVPSVSLRASRYSSDQVLYSPLLLFCTLSTFLWEFCPISDFKVYDQGDDQTSKLIKSDPIVDVRIHTVVCWCYFNSLGTGSVSQPYATKHHSVNPRVSAFSLNIIALHLPSVHPIAPAF